MKTDIRGAFCPNCNRIVVGVSVFDEQIQDATDITVWPFLTERPVPSEVPSHIAEDYREACRTLSISPKASAALSRRCLQTVLREAGKTTKHNLADQIDEVLSKLPGPIAEDVDAIRTVGNFATHPIKDTSTGQIVEVEAGEAEWNLEVLDLLFDHYYVQPALSQQRRDALNKKLQDSNKPPLKAPPSTP